MDNGCANRPTAGSPPLAWGTGRDRIDVLMGVSVATEKQALRLAKRVFGKDAFVAFDSKAPTESEKVPLRERYAKNVARSGELKDR